MTHLFQAKLVMIFYCCRPKSVKSAITMIGGTADFNQLLTYDQVQTFNFVGCLRNVNLNGADATTLPVLAQNGTGSCQRATTLPCSSLSCANGASCEDRWSYGQCVCPKGFTGFLCDQGKKQNSIFIY